MTPSLLRRLARSVHLALAVFIGLYVYLPPTLSGGLREPLMYAVFPVALLSGMFLWQQARIRRWTDSRFIGPAARSRTNEPTG